MYRVNRDLLNPFFDGYKLSTLSITEKEENHEIIKSFKLPSPPWTPEIDYTNDNIQVISDKVYRNRLYTNGQNNLCYPTRNGICEFNLEELKFHSINFPSSLPFEEGITGNFSLLMETMEINSRAICTGQEIVVIDNPSPSISFNLSNQIKIINLNKAKKENDENDENYNKAQEFTLLDWNGKDLFLVYKVKNSIFNVYLFKNEIILNIWNLKTRPLFAKIVSFSPENNDYEKRKKEDMETENGIETDIEETKKGEMILFIHPKSKNDNNQIKNENQTNFILQWFQDDDFIHMELNKNTLVEFESDQSLIIKSDTEQQRIILEQKYNTSKSYWSIEGEIKTISLLKDQIGNQWNHLEFTEESNDLNDSTNQFSSFIDLYRGSELIDRQTVDLISILRNNQIITSHGIDALVIKFDIIQNKINLIHVDTIDAFAYVQTGKINKKFITRTDELTILIENSKHVYLYSQGKYRDQNKWQYVISLDHHQDSNDEIIGYQIIKNNLLFICTMNRLYQISLCPFLKASISR